MRAIDHMDGDQLEVLKLKGMLPSRLSREQIEDARIEARVEAQEEWEDQQENVE